MPAIIKRNPRLVRENAVSSNGPLAGATSGGSIQDGTTYGGQRGVSYENHHMVCYR